MAKPTFPIIEEGVSYNPGDLKQSLGHLWYEGVEDDINRRMVKSIDDLKRIKGGSLASQAIKGASNIVKGIKTDRYGATMQPSNLQKTSAQRFIELPDQDQDQESFINKFARGDYGALGTLKSIYNSIANNQNKGNIDQSTSSTQSTSNNNNEGINWFGKPGRYDKVSDFTPEQLQSLDQARGMGIKGLVHIINKLANPLPELPISPMQQQSMGMSNALSGPLLLSLLNQPQQSSFAPMFASQLAQQPNQGIGDMLSMLAAPAIQGALPYISSLFNRQG